MADVDLILTELINLGKAVGGLGGKVDGLSSRLDHRDEDIGELYQRSENCATWQATHNGCLEGKRESGLQWYYLVTLGVAGLACTALIAETFFI